MTHHGERLIDGYNDGILDSVPDHPYHETIKVSILRFSDHIDSLVTVYG
jgi:hypothetical protein